MRRFRPKTAFLTPISIVLCLGFPTFAEEPRLRDSQAEAQARSITGGLSIIAWRQSLSGDLTLAGSDFDESELDLDEARFAPAVRAEVTTGPWTIRFAAFAVDAGGQSQAETAFTIGSTAIAPGQTLSYDYDYTVAELALQRQLKPVHQDKATGTSISLDPMIGFRVHDLELAVTPRGADRIAESETFFAGLVGAELTLDFGNAFQLEVQVDGSFGDDIWGWSIDAMLSYQPSALVRGEFGFRHVRVDFGGDDDDGVGYDGWNAGLYGGIGFRF